MCLNLVCKCTVRVSHLKMLKVNKQALFRYPWTQHLVCIIQSTFRRNFTWHANIHILNLTGYSTQMCYSVNIPPILSVVVLTETDTNHHLRGTSAHHDDLILALKTWISHVKNKLRLAEKSAVWLCMSAHLCADIWMLASGMTAVYPGSRWKNRV